MARNKLGREKKSPLWLTSYADLVTLMLCFMVLLTSLSVIDERRKHEVLGSVSKTFSADVFLNLKEESSMMDFSEESEGLGHPTVEGKDFLLLKEKISTDSDGDINFQENRFVQILSLSEVMLFKPETTELSSQGIEALDRILPFLINVTYPMLVAGHTAPRLDEEEHLFEIEEEGGSDPTWILSYKRAQAVYDHLVDRGLAESQLSLEAFGQYRPRFNTLSPQGRSRNRRVDLVLDKRNEEVVRGIKSSRVKHEEAKDSHQYKGFDFNLLMPGERAVDPTDHKDPADLGDLGEGLKQEDLEGEELLEEKELKPKDSAQDYWIKIDEELVIEEE